MRRIADILSIAVILSGAAFLWYAHPNEVKGVARAIQARIRPCVVPLTYSIVSIDPRFHVATSTLVADMKEAEAIWEQPSGKDLFAYVEKGGAVSVSLVYDARQASTDKLQTLGYQIDTSTATYEKLKARYDTLSAQFDTAQAALKQRASLYKQHEAAYNADVERWNKRGGAPPQAYQQLQLQKAQLEAEFAAVQASEDALKADVDTLNALATTLNQLIVQLNLNVRQYNREGTSAGEFEEGLYRFSGGRQTIDIYEFSERTQLIRVLAHEMGHALGLDHVADKESVMYEINSGKALLATDADKAELERVCSAGLF